jgi:hypothetical protein
LQQKLIKILYPAHSIMSSDDDDLCYHQPCDDAQRIDTKNMTEMIKAICQP